MTETKSTDKFEGWLPKAEVMKRLGLSERTIDRMVERGKLRQAYRPIPGRRPLPVYDPVLVQELEAEMVKTFPQVVSPAEQKALARPLPAPDRALAWLAESLAAAPRVPIQNKLFLTLKEASNFSGLPQAYLRRLIKQQELKAIKTGGYRIKRADLEKL